MTKFTNTFTNIYICVFIDHFKRLALNKTVGWLTWIMRVLFLTSYTVCYVIYFFMYYLPSSNQPFQNITDSMEIGLIFSALSSFMLFLSFGMCLLYLLFTHSEIRSPLHKNRFFWFSVFTTIIVLITIFHLLFGQDMNHLAPISMLCRQLLYNLYVYTLVILFFPKNIQNDDEYGLTAFTQF